MGRSRGEEEEGRDFWGDGRIAMYRWWRINILGKGS